MKRGQAFIELAIAIPVLLVVLLGGLQVGLALLQLERLGHAARQTAIMLTTGNTNIMPILNATAPAGTTVTSETYCSGSGTIASVALQLQPVDFFPLPAFPTTLTASASATCTA